MTNKTTRAVYVYGNPRHLGSALDLLPFVPTVVYTARELAGYGLGYSFTFDYKPAHRNALALHLTRTLVVVKTPKYARAVVNLYRRFGRQVFWFNGEILSDISTPPLWFVKAYTTWPLEVMDEPERWNEQARNKRRSIEEYLDQHPEALRGPDAVPTFGWIEHFDPADIDVPPTDALHVKHHGGSIEE